MLSAIHHCPLLITWLLWLVPVLGRGQGAPAGQPTSDSSVATPRRLKSSPATSAGTMVRAASVQQLIARAPFNPLNRQNPPAKPVTVLPAQNKAKLLRKIRVAMKANGYSLEAYRPDSLSCRVSKATDAMSRDRYLLWLESPATLAAESSAINVFVQYGNFIHFWGTPAGQESAVMTSAGEYDKKVKLLKSVLDTMPR